MILFIDTSENENFTVALIQQNGEMASEHTVWGGFTSAEKLLPAICWLMKKNVISFKDIAGIIVIAGPGGFTSLRIGVSTANALGYAYAIPVVGVRRSEHRDRKQSIAAGLRMMTSAKKGECAEPFYGADPNITSPRKL